MTGRATRRGAPGCWRAPSRRPLRKRCVRTAAARSCLLIVALTVLLLLRLRLRLLRFLAAG
jgi:hypothetical protein